MAARILVADDEPPIVDVLATVLLDEGYEVASVHDGVAALDALARERFDLLISDIMMPRLSGIELAERVRARETGAPLPIILISAVPPPSVALAATLVLTKPFDIEEVVRVVAHQLAGGGRAPSASRPPPAGISGTDEGSAWR